MRRAFAALIIALMLLAVDIASSTPAHAEQSGWRWADKYICVQDQTPADTNYQRGAYRAQGQIADTNLYINAPRLAACNDKTADQRIKIVAADYGPGFHGRTVVSGYDWRKTDDGHYHWVPRSPVTVQLNTYYGQRTSDEWTRTATHEVLHAVGLDHTERCDSLMHEDVVRCGYDWRITAYDQAELKRLYPTLSLVPAKPRR